jgi:hypothetical protein
MTAQPHNRQTKDTPDPTPADATALPNAWLRQYAALAVTPTEMMTLLHIWQYHRSDQPTQIPLATIASQMGLSRRQVRNYIASLRQKGMIATDERTTDRAGQTASSYDLTPFIDQVSRLDRRQNTSHPPRNDPTYAPRKETAEGGEPSPAAIAERIEAISAHLGDAGHTPSNRTRAYRIWQHSDLTVDAFLEVLDEAADAASKATHIRHTGANGPNRMPYFFACLRNLIAQDQADPAAATPINCYTAYLVTEAQNPHLPLHKHTVWTEVAAQLRDTLTTDNYRKWIQPTRVIHEEPGHLTIQAPDQLHAMWLSAKLEHHIRAALNRIGHADLRLTFVPPEDK